MMVKAGGGLTWSSDWSDFIVRAFWGSSQRLNKLLLSLCLAFPISWRCGGVLGSVADCAVTACSVHSPLPASPDALISIGNIYGMRGIQGSRQELWPADSILYRCAEQQVSVANKPSGDIHHGRKLSAIHFQRAKHHPFFNRRGVWGTTERINQLDSWEVYSYFPEHSFCHFLVTFYDSAILLLCNKWNISHWDKYS